MTQTVVTSATIHKPDPVIRMAMEEDIVTVIIIMITVIYIYIYWFDHLWQIWDNSTVHLLQNLGFIPVRFHNSEVEQHHYSLANLSLDLYFSILNGMELCVCTPCLSKKHFKKEKKKTEKNKTKKKKKKKKIKKKKKKKKKKKNNKTE